LTRATWLGIQMARNRREKITFCIYVDFDTITTNGFTVKLLKDTLDTMLTALKMHYDSTAQSKLNYEMSAISCKIRNKK
jgi:hypothetical protein